MCAAYNLVCNLLKASFDETTIPDVLIAIVMDYLIGSWDHGNHNVIFRADGQTIVSFENPNETCKLWTIKQADVPDIVIMQTLELNGQLFRIKQVHLDPCRIQCRKEQPCTRMGYILERYHGKKWVNVRMKTVANPCFALTHHLNVLKLWMVALLISLNKLNSLHLEVIQESFNELHSHHINLSHPLKLHFAHFPRLYQIDSHTLLITQQTKEREECFYVFLLRLEESSGKWNGVSALSSFEIWPGFAHLYKLSKQRYQLLARYMHYEIICGKLDDVNMSLKLEVNVAARLKLKSNALSFCFEQEFSENNTHASIVPCVRKLF